MKAMRSVRVVRGVKVRRGVKVMQRREVPLPEGWHDGYLRVAGSRVYYRRGPAHEGIPIVHVHGFAISGSYLMPTARRLDGIGTNVVPDLPGYGRSDPSRHALGIPALAQVLEELLDRLGLERVVLLGNSMGCAVSLEVAHLTPERVHRLILVSPAGGRHNQPFRRALRQMAVDARLEAPKMARVAIPDYVRFGPINGLTLFGELTRFPSLERLLSVPVPTLAVLGDRDPLMPGPHRVSEVRAQSPRHVSVVLIQGAAHAINFTHPGELANVVTSWLADREIVDDPTEPGRARRLHFAGDPDEPSEDDVVL